MKVIQILPVFMLGGAERMCQSLTLELAKKGVDVSVISLFSDKNSMTEKLEKSGIKIHYLNKKMGLDLSMPRAIYKILKEEKPDVIHMHLQVVKYAVPAAIFAGIKFRIQTIHNDARMEETKKDRRIRKLFYKFNKVKPVALSEKIKDTVIEEYHLDANKIPVVFNGVSLDNCIVKNDYTVDGNFKILHIGRFFPQKNHIGMIKGFSVFHNKYPDSELWLIGDGEDRALVEKCVLDLSLNDSVKFLGLQDDVYPFLNKADIFALPSLFEGMPITIIEAMGSGLPMTVTNVGGVCDMVKDGEEALYCETTPESIANSFEKLYLDEDLRRKLGQNAFENSKKFSSEGMAENYLNVYKSIMSK